VPTTGQLLTAKRGEGKGLIAVATVDLYLMRGCTVATNMDLYLERIAVSSNRTVCHRIPDWPTAADLDLLPLGNPGLYRDAAGTIKLRPDFSEEQNGLLLLDELSTFLNSRTWQGSDRQALLAWLVHSRKYGWNLFLIAQNIRQLDAQVRESLVELYGNVLRTDKIAVPGIGGLGRMFLGRPLRLPRFHVATFRYGTDPKAPINDRIWTSGKRFYAAYDTAQVIDPELGVRTGQGYSMLSAWHLKGRYQSWLEMNRGQIIGVALMSAMATSLAWWTWPGAKPSKLATSPAAAAASAPAKAYSKDVFVTGLVRSGPSVSAALSDGRVVAAARFAETPAGREILVGDLWYREKP
jgi:hypothetical protein